MGSTTIREVIQEITRGLREASPDGPAPERLRALAAELQQAASGTSPDVAEAIEAVVEILKSANPSSGSPSLADDLRGSVEEIERLLDASASLDESILRGFLDDRADSLDELEDLALELERSGSPESIGAILRIVHSIKGDAGVLSLGDLSELCHELESRLEHADVEAAVQTTLEGAARIRRRFAELASGGTKHAGDEGPSRAGDRLPEPDSMTEVDQELAGEFVVEAREHLESVDAHLLLVEGGDPDQREEAVNGTFRAFHTIKGLAGFLNLNIMMGLAHEAETLLHRVRSEEIPLTDPVVDVSFQVNDALKDLVSAVESSLSSGDPVRPPRNHADLMAALARASTGAPPPTQAEERPAPPPRPGGSPDAPSHPASALSSDAPAVRGTIKVDASRLDRLVDTIGELVIAEAMVGQCDEMPLESAARLPGLLGQLDKTTRELQEMATSLRMVPVRSTFRRMARLARDVAHKLGKRVDFVTRGDDTELDKTVVDVLGDPLVHMVRNAIDHGIEDDSAARERAGKPAAGRIELRARHEGGSIHVEIEDDGRGIDRETILAKARSKGLVENTTDPSDSEVFDLLFAPGFSTTQAVSQVSGRGVGLDVVRRNIESLRGRVEIRSTPGQGSVFSIRLPLTLAIIDGMVVRASGRRYIVPTLSIIRMFRPKPEEVTTVLDRGRLLRVEDELVSLHGLGDLLDLPGPRAPLEESSAVVVESPAGHFAFLVDELLGQQQIVIKPLGGAICRTEGFAGGAIMPDGTVGLILDIAGLVGAVASTPPRRDRSPQGNDQHASDQPVSC